MVRANAQEMQCVIGKLQFAIEKACIRIGLLILHLNVRNITYELGWNTQE